MDCEMLLKVAYDYGQQSGYDRNEYLVSSVKKDGKTYWVFFQGTSGLPGDHFSVAVDTRAQEATKLIRGR